jgi:hypothetical protein
MPMVLPEVALDGADPAQAFAGALWHDILPRAVVCPALPAHVLLHAGPPLRGAPPAPVMNAAIQALLFERLAEDEVQARCLLMAGDVVLEPAQNHGIVTPLAQVVSASMLLGAVTHHAHTAYGALVEGAAPALRFGSTTPACRGRLAVLNEQLLRCVAPCVRRAPIALDAIIRRAVAAGDECHSRTGAANAALVSSIDGLEGAMAAALMAVPAFVLPLVMAGAAAALRHHYCAVEAIGGNGVEFGLRRRGESVWRQMPAQAPAGATADPLGISLPAIGDSVVVDYCGLGGQVDAPQLRQALLDPSSGIIDHSRIVATGMRPAFNLAILDVAGERGLIGRGTYHPPAELFV